MPILDVTLEQTTLDILNKHAGTQAGPDNHAPSMLNVFFQTDCNINMHHYHIWSCRARNVQLKQSWLSFTCKSFFKEEHPIRKQSRTNETTQKNPPWPTIKKKKKFLPHINTESLAVLLILQKAGPLVEMLSWISASQLSLTIGKAHLGKAFSSAHWLRRFPQLLRKRQRLLHHSSSWSSLAGNKDFSNGNYACPT